MGQPEGGLGQGVHQIAEDRSGLDGRKLLRIPEEHQPGRGIQGARQAVHQLQTHHGALIDDHQAMGQGIVPVVPEGLPEGQEGQQAVQGLGLGQVLQELPV